MKLEEELEDIVEDYEEWGFWDLLVLKLAERDLVREYGESAVDQMSDDELEKKRAPYVQKYEKEIEAKGHRKPGNLPDFLKPPLPAVSDIVHRPRLPRGISS